MQCPSGKGVLHSSYDAVQKTEWEICDTCGGVWLDDIELAKAAAHFKSTLPAREQFKAVRVADTGRHTPPANIVCPRDGDLMQSYMYAGDSGIQIDRCPKCFGIWLDGGEIEKLKEYLRADNTQDQLVVSFIQEMEDFERIKKGFEQIPLAIHTAATSPAMIPRMLLNFMITFWQNWEHTGGNQTNKH